MHGSSEPTNNPFGSRISGPNASKYRHSKNQQQHAKTRQAASRRSRHANRHRHKHDQPQNLSRLNAIVTQRATILQQDASKIQTLLLRFNTCLILDFLLDLLYRIGFYPVNADTSKKADDGQKRSVMSKRRKFSDEFKREAVGLTRLPGAQLSQVARDIGVGAGLLGRWRRELETSTTKAFTGSGVPRDQEMATLRRELARVKKERDFLRDAAAFFARESS